MSILTGRSQTAASGLYAVKMLMDTNSPTLSKLTAKPTIESNRWRTSVNAQAARQAQREQ
jgi:hypothetical protein